MKMFEGHSGTVLNCGFTAGIESRSPSGGQSTLTDSIPPGLQIVSTSADNLLKVGP